MSQGYYCQLVHLDNAGLRRCSFSRTSLYKPEARLHWKWTDSQLRSNCSYLYCFAIPRLVVR
jgi:hypothetical protein